MLTGEDGDLGWNQRNSGHETLAPSAAPPPHRQAGPPWGLLLGERRGASGIGSIGGDGELRAGWAQVLQTERRGRWRATRGVGDGQAEAWFFFAYIIYLSFYLFFNI